MKTVYLDNAATSSMNEKVAEKMFDFLKNNYGNPSSVHSFGRKAKVALEEARDICADAVNADPSEIYFTSGGTEANNFLIKGIARTTFEETGKNQVLTNKVEHKSVLDSFDELSKNGFDTYFSPVSKNGSVELSTFLPNIAKDFSLASFMMTNNETGANNNIMELAKLAHTQNMYFHTDAVQAFGKVKIDINQLGVDALSASAHKIGGPKGIGLAFIKSGTPMQALLHGGSQERNRRGGTENIAGIIGFAEAVKFSHNHLFENSNHVKKLKLKLKNGLVQLDSENIFFNDDNLSSPYILSVTLNPQYYNNDIETILMFLDINGIAVSSGSACTSGTLKPSHVILGCGKNVEYANGTIRFSFSKNNTNKEIDYVLEIMGKMLKKFKM